MFPWMKMAGPVESSVMVTSSPMNEWPRQALPWQQHRLVVWKTSFLAPKTSTKLIILQTTLDKLYGNGSCDKGTLCQLKNVFGHINVKKKASECFNHVSDFLYFVTEAHVLLLATRLAGNIDMQELMYTSEQVLQMAKGVALFIWPHMEVENAKSLDDHVYTCICNDDGDKL